MAARITRRAFEENFEKGPGCWIWFGARLNGKGYGSYFGKIASRVSWEHFEGPIPEGFHVLHTCDNPRCVNPSHLFLGTNDDNCKDKAQKGRAFAMFGKDNPMFGKRPAGLDSERTCEHCRITCNLLNFGRWHGDRCKRKPK